MAKDKKTTATSAARAPQAGTGKVHIPLPAVLMGLGMLASPAAVNATAVNDQYSTPFNTTLTGVNVLSNDTFPPNFTAAVTFSTLAQHGVNNVAVNGTLVYVPNPGFSGGDSFIYGITDGTNATVSITVGPAPAIPAVAPAGLALLSAGVVAAAALRRRRQGDKS